jgi:CheY-like chemotaxis protein
MRPSDVRMHAEPSLSPILVAEDDPFDVLLLKNSLSVLGLANPVVTFDNGAELLRYLDPALAVRVQRGSPPGVLFLDLKLARVNGFEVIAAVRDQSVWSALKIVVLSGASDPADAQRAIWLGADEFVLKPIGPALLHDLVAPSDAAEPAVPATPARP